MLAVLCRLGDAYGFQLNTSLHFEFYSLHFNPIAEMLHSNVTDVKNEKVSKYVYYKIHNNGKRTCLH